MRLRSAALIVIGVLAISSILWLRAQPDRSAPGAQYPSVPTAEIGPAAPPEAQLASSYDSASDLLPPPVDLDAADRDLDLFGRVVDAEGAPVPGAAIECIHHPGRRTTTLDLEDHALEIVEATTRSAADGTFAFRLARGDLRELRVTHPEFAETCAPACQAGERVEIVLHTGARIELHTVDEAGAPVAGAEGRLYYPTPLGLSGERRFVTSDAGISELLSLPPGRVSILLEHSLLGTSPVQRLDLAAGDDIVHEIVMPAGRAIAGTVRDRETGLPVEGARVGDGWTLRRFVLTDARGEYRLAGLGAGRRELHVDADGYGREQASVPEEHSGPLDIELRRGEVAVGTVVDPDGAPVAELVVHAVGTTPLGTGQRIESRRATTGADGRFRIESLHTELPHALIVQAPGFGRTRRDIDGSRRGPDGAIDLGTITLVPGRAIEGELVDGDGKPLPGTAVSLLGDDAGSAGADPGRDWLGFYGREEERRTDDLGRFRFPDLAPGEYRLTVDVSGKPRLEKPVRIAESDPEVVHVRLALAGGSGFQVQVLLPDGRPAEKASVSATRGRSGFGASQRTDAEGIARFEGMRGRIRVLVHGPRGTIAPEPIEIEPRGQTERVVLGLATYVRGVVVSSEGEPFAGMELQSRLRRPDGVEDGHACHTEADGSFEIVAHPGTVIEIVCRGSMLGTLSDGRRNRSWVPRSGALRGVVAPAENLRLVLEEVATDRILDVRVVAPGGEPLEGIRVFAFSVGGGDHGASVTNAEGRVRFSGLPALEIGVFSTLPEVPPSIGGDAWVQSEHAKVFPAGQEITLALRTGWRLLGTAVDTADLPIEKGWVFGELSGDRIIHQPFAQGMFEIVILEGETAKLVVEAEREGAVLTSGEIEVHGGERSRRFILRE